MQKEHGAELYKDLCIISSSCKNVLVGVGFREYMALGLFYKKNKS
jgi:hypothetical protein